MPKDVDLEQIKELIRLVEKYNLAELTVEEDGITITVKGPAGHANQPAEHQPRPQPAEIDAEASATDVAETPADEEEPDNLVRIESPMIGVFYRASSPDSPPFIEVGDGIEIGQTIGVIEAMKVFSEIPSEVAGEVVNIPAQNGKLVQQGETLVLVRVP
ncbi:MAG: acetyl-CoA carboxylase biotin carboxyl carrier protein [Armatimonadetes bacterium]|nr:acetyl-CoA carboxylase biotin carboxyl carrier protein [Armatimonadota bacterium]